MGSFWFSAHKPRTRPPPRACKKAAPTEGAPAEAEGSPTCPPCMLPIPTWGRHHAATKPTTSARAPATGGGGARRHSGVTEPMLAGFPTPGSQPASARGGRTQCRARGARPSPHVCCVLLPHLAVRFRCHVCTILSASQHCSLFDCTRLIPTNSEMITLMRPLQWPLNRMRSGTRVPRMPPLDWTDAAARKAAALDSPRGNGSGWEWRAPLRQSVAAGVDCSPSLLSGLLCDCFLTKLETSELRCVHVRLSGGAVKGMHMSSRARSSTPDRQCPGSTTA